jgi:hypothetical protein
MIKGYFFKIKSTINKRQFYIIIPNIKSNIKKFTSLEWIKTTDLTMNKQTKCLFFIFCFKTEHFLFLQGENENS